MKNYIVNKYVAFLAAGFVLAACADRAPYVFQAPAANEPEAQIRFVQYGTVDSWHADTDRLLYVQGRDRQWYRVDLFSPCFGLEYASGIRFIPSDGAGTFDRFSHVAIRGQRCKVESVKRIPPPVRSTTPTARPAAATRAL